jgi:sulfoxide reductase heme-binding subunit YedZ
VPVVWLVAEAVTGTLGVNPIEGINRFLGDWALRFLLLSLALTPLRGITGWAWPIRLRRMIGLFAFFYVSLHLTSYVVLDHFFDWRTILADIVKRPYITIGMAVFAALIPLAATSTSGMIKLLGGRNWKRLHRLVYLAGIGGVVHYYLLVKADVREPLVYAAILAALLGYRLVVAASRYLRAAARSAIVRA